MTSATTSIHFVLAFILLALCPLFVTPSQGAPLPTSSSSLVPERATTAPVVDTVLEKILSSIAPVCSEGACLQVGPRLASVDSNRGALISALFNALLGNSVNVTVLDWNSIAGADVQLLDLLQALDTNLTLASPEEALTTDITLAQLVTATADVVEADGNTAAAAALNALAADISGLSGTIQLGDLVQADFPTGSLSNVKLDVLDLVTGSVQLFNFDNVATTPSPVTIDDAGVLAALGLGGVLSTGGAEIYAQVVEPPVFICGPAGTTAYSAAIRLKLNLDLVDTNLDVADALAPLGIANLTAAEVSLVDLELYIAVARAQAVISSIAGQAIDVNATPGVVDLYLGTIPDAVFFNRSNPTATIAAALDFTTIGTLALTIDTIALPPITTTGNLRARSFAEGDAPVNNAMTFSGPYPETQTANTSATFVADLISDTVQDDGLMQNLELELTGGPLLTLLGLLVDDVITAVSPIVTGSLAPTLSTILGNFVDPLLENLGIRLGEAEVTVFSAVSDCDSDGDGIPDAAEDTNGDRNPDNDDADSDGFPNYLDIDSDDDGITDDTEAGAISVFPDDTDADGVPDYLDIDADGDGITDNIEGQTSGGFVAPSGDDIDNDGLDDAYDADTASTAPGASQGVQPTNTDGIDQPDYRDLDSDNDTIVDANEGHDANEDGDPDRTPAVDGSGNPVDTDGDGLNEAFDPSNGGIAAPLPDTDSNGMPNFRDTDDDSDLIATDMETGDVAPMNGTPDYLEANPATQDSDGDGIPDTTEGNTDSDGDGIPNFQDIDSDNDGILDIDEAQAALLEPPADSDGDLVPDFLDIDSDSDGIPDNVEAQRVGIFTPPTLVDIDQDGLSDVYDASVVGTTSKLPTESLGLTPFDMNDDGTPNHLDPDSDGDTIPDAIEGHDWNRDGVADTVPAINGATGLPEDADGDGLNDAFDVINVASTPLTNPNNGISVPGNGLPEMDRDSLPDFLDIDVDDDGITDLVEITNAFDSDSDGVPDYLDIDADGDGIPDNVEGQPTGPFTAPTDTDADADGLDDQYDVDLASLTPQDSQGIAPANTDENEDGGDLIPDYLDDDSDADTVPDSNEGHDVNFDGEPDRVPVVDGAGNGLDTDLDGLNDGYDVVNLLIGSPNASIHGALATSAAGGNANNGIATTRTDVPNLDQDPEPNFRDTDDNGDGIPTREQSAGGSTEYLPVELTSFEVQLDGHSALLAWATASETNNAGFNIEHKTTDADWKTLQWIDGHGTTEAEQAYSFRADDLAPGSHTFRLKQIDYDGTFDYSPEVEVIVELAERFVMESAYPNPFNPEATMRFAVNRAQAVEVSMYDLMGRRVQVLWSGEAQAGRMQEVRIDGSGLASGVYLVRAVGNGFAQTQRVTLVK